MVNIATNLLLCHYNYCVSRGDDFWVAFSKLGTLRSILQSHVNVIALTATATQETFRCVKDRLSMKDVALIGMYPGRVNIKYIMKPSINVDELSSLLAAELSELHTKFHFLQYTFAMCKLTDITEKAFEGKNNRTTWYAIN